MKMFQWQEEGYLRKDENGNPVTLEEYENRTPTGKKGIHISSGDLQLYLITGVGFFLDSYDLFIINLAQPIWTYEYWGGPDGNNNYPALLKGAVNAASNIGNLFGQIAFGFLGDTFGRRFVYGKELIICIVGTILVIGLPNSIPTPTLKMAWIFCFRFLMGIGIGGDYPMSASIVSERSNLHSRGQLLGLIFSNQGWGTLAGSVVTVILLSCFSSSLNGGDYGKLDVVWRIQMGLPLIPAFATLWPRLTMPESRKFLQSQELNNSGGSVSTSPEGNTPVTSIGYNQNFPIIVEPFSASSEQREKNVKKTDAQEPTPATLAPNAPDVDQMKEVPETHRAKLNTFFVYFSTWKHAKTLIGTASTWFLLDVAFYGTNLNQTILLQAIGYSTGSNEYQRLFRNAIGNLIIAGAGYVPGYFFTVFFIERLGRRWIQIQGFLIVALMFAIIAGGYNRIGTASMFVCFAIAQFFFNFGPNATTFIVPAEVFPSRVRGFAHGMSAACGKLGAILSGLLFNYLSADVIGLQSVLWIFFSCNILGAIITFFLIVETKGRDADAIDYKECLQAAREARVEKTKGQ